MAKERLGNFSIKLLKMEVEKEPERPWLKI